MSAFLPCRLLAPPVLPRPVGWPEQGQHVCATCHTQSELQLPCVCTCKPSTMPPASPAPPPSRHKRGIVHRDLKSPNLLVDQVWRVKVAGEQLLVMDRACSLNAVPLKDACIAMIKKMQCQAGRFCGRAGNRWATVHLLLVEHPNASQCPRDATLLQQHCCGCLCDCRAVATRGNMPPDFKDFSLSKLDCCAVVL